MALRKISKTQTDTATWSADSAGIGTDIEKNGVLTRIDATVELTTFAGTGNPTDVNAPDGLFRVVQNLRLVGGGHTYFTLPADDAAMGGTLFHYMNRHDFQMAGHRDALFATPEHVYIPVSWVLHAGSRPFDQFGRPNPFDLSGVIPTLQETTLRTEWVTSGGDVMDNAQTFTAAVMRFNLHYLVGTHQEIMAEMQRQRVTIPKQAAELGATAMIPAWIAEVFAHTATSSDYSTERNIPTDGWLKRICIAEQEATGDRSIRAEDQVTGVKVLIRGEDIIKEFVDPWTLGLDFASQLTVDHAAPDYGNQAPVGILLQNLDDFLNLQVDPRNQIFLSFESRRLGV